MADLPKKEEGIQELSIGISLPFGLSMLSVKGVSEMFFSAWPAPNVNSCGGIFRGPEKMEVVPKLLLKAGTGTGSLAFVKPKDGRPGGTKGRGGLPISTDPKIFCSYSCNCW